MKEVTEIVSSLYTAPAYILVGLSAIVFGYLLRPIKRFPNDGIPVACVLWSIGFTLATMPQCPTGVGRISWRATNIMIGIIVGFGAWVFHKQILSRIEDKIPWFNKPTPPLPNADPHS
jgi:hypothetical protein